MVGVLVWRAGGWRVSFGGAGKGGLSTNRGSWGVGGTKRVGVVVGRK